MSTIATLQYNPYSNREKKGYTLYTGYAPYVVGTFSGINFNPADGVNTELILNTVSDKADYLLVLEGANNTIASRWFILDADRTRGGQYHLQLYRDVVYDNLPEVMQSTAFIEKGWINDINNPLLFNEEALPTNQRKIDERLIRDETRTPWIVGYMPKHINLEEGETLTVDIEDNQVRPIELTSAEYRALTQFSYAIEDELPQPLFAMFNFSVGWNVIAYRREYLNRKLDFWGWLTSEKALPGQYTSGVDIYTDFDIFKSLNYAFTIRNKIDNAVGKNIGSLLKDYKSSFTNIILNRQLQSKLSEIEKFKDKFVLYDNVVYKVTLGSPERSGLNTLDLRDVPNFENDFKNTIINTALEYDSDSRVEFNSGYAPILYYELNRIPITLEEAKPSTNYSVVIPNDATRLVLNEDANYTMFCMPYFDFSFKKEDDTYLTLPGYLSRITAQSISRKFSGSGTLIDLQLLPYCPIRETLNSTMRSVDFDNLIPFQATPIKDANNNILSYLFWCTTSQIAIQRSYYFDIGANLTDYKINSQTVIHRICAPDKSAMYEYSPHKVINARTVSMKEIYYNIRCNYKPYNPFIYVEVTSEADSLYGQSFVDGRGLICSGDFSLPQTSDAWETYQIQNKNYSNIFNREVQSIELQQKYAKMNDITNAVTGTISGITGGATTGFAVGGPAGAVAGGIVSGIASGIGGALDVSINDTLRKDQLDLKKDLYNYTLQNIQALPNTILNVGTLNDVNKLYPYIEVYDCTSVEKQALLNKIKYNGMSIGVISEGLSEYIIDHASDRSFIKGQIIKIDLHDDYHMLKQIRQEFETGFFINRGGN